jgi:hypothetical protein
MGSGPVTLRLALTPLTRTHDEEHAAAVAAKCSNGVRGARDVVRALEQHWGTRMQRTRYTQVALSASVHCSSIAGINWRAHVIAQRGWVTMGAPTFGTQH